MESSPLPAGEASLLWHTTPLHYLPYLLQSGVILSAAQLVAGKHPIRPRRTAIVRKTKLGLADYVHLSPTPITPLLSDKCLKGYPHILIAFDRARVASLPGMALLKFNTKRWAHRDDFVPVTEEVQKASIWTEHAQGKYPSLEILVRERLDLSLATGVFFSSDEEAVMVWELIAPLVFSVPPIQIRPEYFPQMEKRSNLKRIREYFMESAFEQTILPPPEIPFD